MAGDRAEAAPAGHLQGQQGPGVRGEGGRHCRALPRPASRGDRPECGREDAGPGVGSDPAAAAARVRRHREAHHDYIRHGTTNLFAALNVRTGEVVGECRPSRDGDTFLAFLKKAVKPHAGKEVHVVLDNLSTHTTPEVKEWLEKNPNVEFHFTPVGSSWLNQIET